MKKRHLQFLYQQKINQAALLLTGMPELEAQPLSRWWTRQGGRLFSLFRRVFEQLVTELTFVFPWVGKGLHSTSLVARRDLKRGISIFPLEFWLSLALVAGTGLLLAW